LDENGNRIKKKRVLATRPKLEPNPSAASEPPQLRITDKALSALTKGRERYGELGHSSLPLLFVRPSDGTGYHSGKNVAIEKIEGTVMEPEGWSELLVDRFSRSRGRQLTLLHASQSSVWSKADGDFPMVDVDRAAVVWLYAAHVDSWPHV
jgi:hypothetical protein